MEQHGWQFHLTHDGSIFSDVYENVGKKCGHRAKWYGWSSDTDAGSFARAIMFNFKCYAEREWRSNN